MAFLLDIKVTVHRGLSRFSRRKRRHKRIDVLAAKMGLSPLRRERGQSMAIEVQCVNGHVLRVKGSFAGKIGLCPQCRGAVHVPASNRTDTAKKTKLCVKCCNAVSESLAVCPWCAAPLRTYRHLNLRKDGSRIVAGFVDRRLVDEPTTVGIVKELRSIADELRQQDLVLDLSAVAVLSSAMLGKLLTLQIDMENKGRGLRLCRVDPKVREVLAVANLDHMFHIEDERAGRSQAFSRNRPIAAGVAANPATR